MKHDDDSDDGSYEDLDIDALLLGVPVSERAGLRGDRRARGVAEQEDRTGTGSGDAEVRVHSASLLWIKHAAAAVEARCARLERALERQKGELQRVQKEIALQRHATYAARLDTVNCLVAAAECKDPETAAHIERIGLYSSIIAKTLGLESDQVSTLRLAAPMHDVGKLGVPDAILQKTSPLTTAEWEVMKRHTVFGARMLGGSPSPLLVTGAAIALAHHEHWDGGGYPHGISGQEIPLEARICAVADVFDALSTDRRYREALPASTVVEMMESQRGRQFDPDVLDAFLSCRTEFAKAT